MEFSANEEINNEMLTALLEGKVPQEWQSTDKFTNKCDMNEPWQKMLLKALGETIVTSNPGTDKKENKDFYAFNMEPKFALSKSLQESGWKQFNCTIRLGQLPNQKAKRTHYTFHFWAQPYPEDGFRHSSIILLKLKLEGKFIPSTKEEQQMIINLTQQYLD